MMCVGYLLCGSWLPLNSYMKSHLASSRYNWSSTGLLILFPCHLRDSYVGVASSNLKLLPQEEDLGTGSLPLDRSLTPFSTLVFPSLPREVTTLGSAVDPVGKAPPAVCAGSSAVPSTGDLSRASAEPDTYLTNQSWRASPDPVAPPSLSLISGCGSPLPVISCHPCLCFSFCFRDLFLCKGHR